MATHDYHFVTHWRVAGTIDEVFDIIADSNALAEWWPSVYLAVHEVSAGDENGIGRELDLHTKGWLPYTLKWRLKVREAEPPVRIVIGASGDFAGLGTWTLTPDGDFVNITFDWRIAAEKPLLKYGSFVLKPIFARNHEWAMMRGLESLELELKRRRALSERDAASSDSWSADQLPPAPSKFDAKSAAFFAFCGVLALAVLLRRKKR